MAAKSWQERALRNQREIGEAWETSLIVQVVLQMDIWDHIIWKHGNSNGGNRDTAVLHSAINVQHDDATISFRGWAGK